MSTTKIQEFTMNKPLMKTIEYLSEFYMKDYVRPSEIAEETKTSKAKVYDSLKFLEERGMVNSEKVGAYTFYGLELENSLVKAFVDFFKAIETHKDEEYVEIEE